MKKLMMITLVAAAIFPACKKDKTAPGIKPVNELIKGTWVATAEKYSFYNNDQNTSEVNAAPGNFKYTITDKITKTKLSTNEVEVNNTDYIITTETDGKNHIHFKAKDRYHHNNVIEDQDFEIIYLTDQTMQWRQVKAKEVKYTDNGVEKKITKIITTLTFKKDNTK